MRSASPGNCTRVVDYEDLHEHAIGWTHLPDRVRWDISNSFWISTFAFYFIKYIYNSWVFSLRHAGPMYSSCNSVDSRTNSKEHRLYDNVGLSMHTIYFTEKHFLAETFSGVPLGTVCTHCGQCRLTVQPRFLLFVFTRLMDDSSVAVIIKLQETMYILPNFGLEIFHQTYHLKL